MWRKKPVELMNLDDSDLIPTYIMAIDENGTSSFNDDTHFFTVTGVVFKVEDCFEMLKNFMDIKLSHWENGMHDGKRVVFHSRDIRKSSGFYSRKIIDSELFRQDLIEFLKNIDVEVYSSTVNKLKLRKQYISPYNPYDINMQFIVERFHKRLSREKATGIIYLESRGGKEDYDLHQMIIDFFEHGNNYYSGGHFDRISGVFFNKKTTNDEKKSYWQLEIADLISYAIFRKISQNDKTEIFEVIEPKLSYYPNYEGKGVKLFPK